MELTFSPDAQSPGDCNTDGLVDLGDLDLYIVCLQGPAHEVDACCYCSDLSGDTAAALDDFALWQNQFGAVP
jgi:hypothetical protein